MTETSTAKLRKHEISQSTLLGAFERLLKAAISFVMSVRLYVRPSLCPHGTTSLPPEGFSLNFTFMSFFFPEIYGENSSLIKI